MNTDHTEIREERTVFSDINTSLVFFMLFMSILPISVILPSTYLFLKYALTFLVALMLAWWATPLARNTALRYNIVDVPDGRLKDHTQPTSVGGNQFSIVNDSTRLPSSIFLRFEFSIFCKIQ